MPKINRTPRYFDGWFGPFLLDELNITDVKIHKEDVRSHQRIQEYPWSKLKLKLGLCIRHLGFSPGIGRRNIEFPWTHDNLKCAMKSKIPQHALYIKPWHLFHNLRYPLSIFPAKSRFGFANFFPEFSICSNFQNAQTNALHNISPFLTNIFSYVNAAASNQWNLFAVVAFFIRVFTSSVNLPGFMIPQI